MAVPMKKAMGQQPSQPLPPFPPRVQGVPTDPSLGGIGDALPGQPPLMDGGGGNMAPDPMTAPSLTPGAGNPNAAVGVKRQKPQNVAQLSAYLQQLQNGYSR